METRIHRPASLAPWVSCFWLTVGQGPGPRRERVLPSGTVDLVINLGEDRFDAYRSDEVTPLDPLPGVVASGAHAGSFVIAMAARTAALGVHFRPGGAAAFVGLPPAELEGRQVDLEDVWGRAARSLRGQLVEAGPERCFPVLESFLLARLGTAQRHPAVALALRAFDDPALRSVGALNEETGLTPARFITLFRREVGLSPKAFWRVRRFRAALRALTGGPPSLAALAADLGYCDQAHLNRDFRHFTGLSPRGYLAETIVRPNHVPIRGQ